MIYKLTEWEDNGYHDSYFHESWWNTETESVEFHEVGATAYGGGIGSEYPPIADVSILEDAIQWLANHIFQVIRAAEYRDILEPQTVKKGEIVSLLRDVKKRKTAKSPGGEFKSGTTGEVTWIGSFGQFYAKGYNRPNRENTSVGVRISPEANAPWIFFTLKDLRLAKEPMTDEELRIRANRLARDCQFSAASGRKFAWDSKNHASALLHRKGDN